MERLGVWVAQQFDNGVSAVGAAIVLALAACGIGGALALVSGHVWAGSALLGACLVLLAALMLAAFKTDPDRKLSRAERADRWRRLPAYFKVSLWILTGGTMLGQFADLLVPHRALDFSLSMLSGGVGALVWARGMQTHQPPIPVRGAEALTPDSAPEQYRRKLRSIIGAMYVSGLLMVVASMLALVERAHR